MKVFNFLGILLLFLIFLTFGCHRTDDSIPTPSNSNTLNEDSLHREDSLNSYIFLPQGGVNIFKIPGKDSGYYSVNVAHKQIRINIPILAHGSAEDDNFSVSVDANPDTLNKLIENGTLSNTKGLGSEIYSFPNMVHIEKGRLSVVPITLDLDSIPTNSEKLALAISLSNPSKYYVASTKRTIIITIDYKALFSKKKKSKIWAFKNLLGQRFLTIGDQNKLTVTTDTVYWSITKNGEGDSVLIKNVDTGKYLKFVGAGMTDGFQVATYDSTDAFYLHLVNVSNKYRLDDNFKDKARGAFAIAVHGDLSVVTCIDSYQQGQTGSYPVFEVLKKWYPNRVWIAIPKE